MYRNHHIQPKPPRSSFPSILLSFNSISRLKDQFYQIEVTICFKLTQIKGEQRKLEKLWVSTKYIILDDICIYINKRNADNWRA